MEKDNIHSIRNCKSRMDFVGSAVLLLIPIITLEIIGVLKTTISFFVLGNIIIWGIYLFLLWALIRECTSGIVNQNGVEITFYNFKEWTETFSWEEYEEIKIENTQWGQHGAHVLSPLRIFYFYFFILFPRKSLRPFFKIVKCNLDAVLIYYT